MKKTLPYIKWIMMGVSCLPMFYAAKIYPELPATIPIHFNLKGQPDGWGDKGNIWLSAIVLWVMSVGLYFLLVNMKKIDPKRTAGQSPELFQKIAVILVVFLSALNLIIVDSARSGTVNMTKFMMPLMGLLFLVLGNYMHSIKPNYFVGFRLPWTLESEDNWRKTHQLVSKIWVAGGILITITSLLFPPGISIFFFGIALALMIIVPTVFSYRYFKKNKQH